MSQTITLDLPDETVALYQKGAAAARKPLEEFLVDRLREAAPAYSVDSETHPLNEDLDELNRLSDGDLWLVARQRLSDDEQKRYGELLEKNRLALLSLQEQVTMEKLGNRARRLTLRKAHAFMLLKWRGYTLPSLDEMQEEE